MTIVVGLISQKGGVGKSTLSRALAVEAANNGLSVHIADLDAQQFTVTEWAALRSSAAISPAVTSATYHTLKDVLDNAPAADLLIIDGPARTSSGTLEIAKIADLIVQPTGASRDDLNPAIRTFHELVAKRIASGKLVMALCRVLGDSEAAEARRYVVQAGYTVLEGHLTERISYRTAQNLGRAITETDYDSLNDKARELINGLVARLERKAAA